MSCIKTLINEILQIGGATTAAVTQVLYVKVTRPVRFVLWFNSDDKVKDLIACQILFQGHIGT